MVFSLLYTLQTSPGSAAALKGFSGAVRMRNSWKYPVSRDHLLPSAERKAEKTLQAQARHGDLNMLLVPVSSLHRKALPEDALIGLLCYIEYIYLVA